MTAISAAHAAAPSLPLAPAFHAIEEVSGTGTQFANELNGITEESVAPDDAGKSLVKASVQQVLALPQPSVQKNPPVVPATSPEPQPAVTAAPPATPRTTPPAPTIIRPSTTGVSKRPAQKEPSAGNQTAAVPAIFAPVPEIPAVLAAPPADEDDASSARDNSGIAVNPPAGHSAPEEPSEQAPPAVTTGAPGQASPNMAFAARVQPEDNANRSTISAEMASASAVASASKKIENAGQDETGAPAELRAGMPAAAVTVERAVEPVSGPAPSPSTHAAATPHRAEAPTLVSESASKSSTPLKDISLQVNQPGKERVDVRVVQQGSEVRVSVHSGDAVLNTGLRQGLSELQGRLEETGYRSEMWRPGTAIAPVASAVSPQASSNHSRGGEGQPQQQGGSQQEGGRRNPNSSNQPRWVEELESSFATGEQPTGGFYGFSS